MTRSLFLLCSVFVVLCANAQNQCSTALPITAGVWVVDTIDGTEVPEPLCANTGTQNMDGGEWYTYTPSEDVALTITTELAVNNGRDTRFHVYSGTCGALNCVGGDDDSGTGYLSVAVINMTAGTTYTIVFDDRWEPVGFSFELIENAPVFYPIAFTSTTITTVGSTFAVVDMNDDQLDDVVSVGST
ncbi:MAG: RNA-binding protein, partial [Flavobacteriales bacterium]|nr:RNA-binding protein [Flavobacteriales bacterium]